MLRSRKKYHLARHQVAAGLQMVYGRDIVGRLREIVAGAHSARDQSPYRVTAMNDYSIVVSGTRGVNATAPEQRRNKNQREGERLNKGNQAGSRSSTIWEHA